ncbi:MAG: RsmG family class I SAM-dependent methyltransferase [Acidobacteriota bacterium]
MNLPETNENDLKEYIIILKKYSRKINIISKTITDEQLEDLVSESLLIDKYTKGTNVVDAGSGNGILGIPIAILHPEKKIILVEPRKKKSEFLNYAVKELKLSNVEVLRSGIEEFVKRNKKMRFSIIARGFPDNNKLISYVKKKVAEELILITSLSKIKKVEKGIEKYEQKIYNVPFRDNLKIMYIANVSRETQGENG